jgi:uncharacterized delta-60 repeat protein
MRPTARLAALAAVATLLVTPAAALAGYDSLDGSFGQAGIARTVHPGNDEARAIAYDGVGGGRVVAAGGGAIDDPSRPGATALTLVRLGENGAPDTAFGGGDGIVQTDTGRQSARFEAVDIDAQGRIVAVGTSTGFDGIGASVVVARYLDDGSPDPSFGEDGIVTLGGNDLWIAEDAVLQPDGIVILAMTSGAGGPRPTVVRLTETGSLDDSFGSLGQRRFLTGKLEAASSIAEDRGRLILAGTSANRDFAAAWLGPDGETLKDLGDSGFTRVRFPGPAEATEVATDASGRTILAGRCSCGRRESAAVARLRPSGAVDSDFSGDGHATIRLGGHRASSVASALTSVPGRKVAVGVVVSGSTGRRSALVRLTSSGKPDRTFSNDGVTSPGFRTQVIPGYRGDEVDDIVVDPFGRVLAAATLFTEDSDFLIARFVP